MSTVQRVAKNFIFLYASNIIITLLSLLLSVVIARQLGDVIFGKYSFAVAFTVLFAVGLDLGFNLVIVRDVAKDKSLATKYLGNVIIIKAILSVVIYGLIALTIYLMDYPHDTVTVVLIFGVFIIFTAFADIFRVIFRAFERMEYEALTSTLRRLIGASLGLIAVYLGYGLIAIASAIAISGLFDLIFSLVVCTRKFAKPRISVDLDLWKSMTKVALPFAFLAITGIIYTRIDTIMLSSMKGDAVVGWYNAANSLVLMLQTIPSIFLTALFPVLFVFSVSSLNSLKVSCQKSLQLLFMLGLPIAAGATLLADRIIPLLYGDKFTHSIVALQILAWYALFLFVYLTLGHVLISLNKQNQLTAVGGGGAVINVILNLVLIPPLSYKGAAIATVATGAIIFISNFYLTTKYLYRPSLHKIVIKPVIACAIMALFVYLCSSINLAALIISAAALYLVVLYLIGGLSREDLGMLRQMLRRSKQPNESREDTDSSTEDKAS